MKTVIPNSFDRGNVKNVTLASATRWLASVEEGILTIRIGSTQYMAFAPCTDGPVQAFVDGDTVTLYPNTR